VTRWVAGAGAFVISLDSMVNIAFPAIAAGFALPPEAMRWVIVCYVFTYAIMSFAGGTLADRLGHIAVFTTGLALSTVAFGVAAMAPTFAWLLAGRVLQGFAGGLVYGTAPALATLAAPPAERTRAIGFLNASIGVAFAVGPVVAGALVRWLGWRAVFVARVPVALLVFAWAWATDAPSAGAGPLPRLAAGAFVRTRVLRDCALSFVANAGIFAIWLLAPFYLMGLRGLDALSGGLMFMLTPLGTASAALVAGRLAGELGRHRTTLVGLVIEAVGLSAMSAAPADSSLVLVAAALFASGFGLGLFQVPNMASVMEAFPARQQGAAGGLAFMARTLGVVTGVATLSTVFSWRRLTAGVESGFTVAFLVAASSVTVAALGALASRRGGAA
jgi:MFS family permease